MAEVLPYIAPAPLASGFEPARRTRAARDPDSLGSAEYKAGDLVYVDSGDNAYVKKSVQTTAANLEKLAFAASDWDVGPLNTTRYSYWANRGVPLELIGDEQRVIFTYQGNAANGSNYVFTAADKIAVQSKALRDLLFNSTEGVLTIRNTSAVGSVRMVEIVDGDVGDSNVRIACEIQPAFRLVG